jgi:betaine-aldehyde dehydrogenase
MTRTRLATTIHSMQTQLYIGGKWLEADGQLEVVNPATEAIVHHAPAASAAQVDLAVNAARAAFPAWSALSGAARGEHLRAIAAGIRANKEELARLEVMQNGKPLPEALWDMDDCAACFDYYAGLAEQLDSSAEKPIALPHADFSSIARLEPIGVAAQIVPWNYPLLMATWKVAPALAAGCTSVLKPSELTPLTALELARIAHEAGLPAGVLNVVSGGRDAGAALSAHEGVDKLAFTGSLETGRKVMRNASERIVNTTLELGGKSAIVVFDDTDVEQAVEWVMFGIFWNKGEVCSATSRLIVQDGIAPRLLTRLKEECERVKIGDPLEDGVLLGPLVSRGQYEKVTGFVRRGLEAGLKLLTGGERPAQLERGFYLEPTVFVDVPETSEAWLEEIFGPVLCVRQFSTEAEAVQLANTSQYGLAAAVMSRDLERANRVARALRAGIVWVNCSQPTFCEAPWGGMKRSGIGRELGEWGLQNYLETKQITTYNTTDKAWGWYIKG